MMQTSSLALAAFDFDGTGFRTDKLSPNGMSVSRAYEKAVETCFGHHALQFYRDSGGLQNGDPVDVVRRLWSEPFQPGMLTNAYDLYRKSQVTVVQARKKEIDWEYPFTAAVELLVCEKLRQLLPEIGVQFPDGSMWPCPLPGFLEYWKKISARRRGS